MRLPHYLVRSATGVFHFRLKVPPALFAHFGLRVVKRSLHTREPKTAQAYAYGLFVRYAGLFAAHRDAAMPKPPSLADILSSVDRGHTRTYELELDAHTRQPTRIRTDGTEADHLRAIQAMGVVFAQPLPPRLTLPEKKGTGLTWEQALVLYAEAESKGLKPNTWAQRQRACESFTKAIGAKTPVVNITRVMAAKWAHGLIVGGRSKRTVGNVVSQVAQVFRMLLVRGEIEGVNPVKGVVVVSKKEKAARRDEGFEWEPFELADLKRVFDPANLKRTTTEHVRWGALMGLYTGARVGEVAQLFLSDFDLVEGIPCVRFHVANDGQTIKTEDSRRLVPLHPDLLRLGLWERVERLRSEGEQRLFPKMRIDSGAGTGNAISKGFVYYVQTQLGLKPRRKNGILAFHSLRKNVIQMLQGAAVPEERRRAFVGHEHGDQDVHRSTYMRTWTSEELATLFPGLKWSEWLNLEEMEALLR